MLGHGHPWIANGFIAAVAVLVVCEVILGLYMAIKLLAAPPLTTEGYLQFISVSVAWEAIAITIDMAVM